MTTPKDILLLKKLWEQSLVSHNLLDAPLKTFCKEIIEGKQVSLGEVLVRLGVISAKQLQTLEQEGQQLLREIAPQQFASTSLNINASQCTNLQKLGSSALGNTYQGSHEDLPNQCTIKYIEGILATNRKFLKRFFLQIEKLVGLSHENLAVTYYSSYEKLEIIREHVPGNNLQDYIEESGASLSRACDIIMQAAKGLNFAYQHGILHKNLKPTNIIITPDDDVKVVDFCLPPTSPAHLSPEQCQKQKSDVRSDIYTLGLLFYYLLTDHPAIEANTSKEIMESIISCSFVEKDTENLPTNVLDILRKMTAKLPQERYASYNDLIADLENNAPRQRIQPADIDSLMHTAEIALSVDDKQELFLSDTVDDIPEPYEDQMTLEAEEVDDFDSHHDDKEDSLTAVAVAEEDHKEEIKISQRPLPKFNVQEIKNSPEVKRFDLEDKEQEEEQEQEPPKETPQPEEQEENSQENEKGSLLQKPNKLKPYFLKNLQKKAEEDRKKNQ
ncbi:serine/threonine protein kinase [Candidatus Uabimicrobium amorphum]|uniref:Serine/threonine protein kinase n=1 Tax=Uabimicrobium amorphum TaxID=2596890 RepID=A0A5S9F3P3_UABAM|nr:serine/threonine-protein kinase [Candidatus Uabimicrobium amorphum]BBM83644.1 serine/threonine protein kinase [Candidatus Uabimicrobium amorphum]